MKPKLTIFLKYLGRYLLMLFTLEGCFLAINFLVYIFDTKAELFSIISDTRIQVFSFLIPIVIIIFLLDKS